MTDGDSSSFHCPAHLSDRCTTNEWTKSFLCTVIRLFAWVELFTLERVRKLTMVIVITIVYCILSAWKVWFRPSTENVVQFSNSVRKLKIVIARSVFICEKIG